MLLLPHTANADFVEDLYLGAHSSSRCALKLSLAQFLQYSYLPIRFHHHFAPALDFLGNNSSLLGGCLTFGFQKQFVPLRFHQTIHINLAGLQVALGAICQIPQVRLDLCNSPLDDRFRPLSFGQLQSPLIAIGLAKPQQCRQTKFVGKHG